MTMLSASGTGPPGPSEGVAGADAGTTPVTAAVPTENEKAERRRRCRMTRNEVGERRTMKECNKIAARQATGRAYRPEYTRFAFWWRNAKDGCGPNAGRETVAAIPPSYL
jgi:hypothetical protein